MPYLDLWSDVKRTAERSVDLSAVEKLIEEFDSPLKPGLRDSVAERIRVFAEARQQPPEDMLDDLRAELVEER